MIYSAADTAIIKALGNEQGISAAEATKLVQYDMAVSGHDLPTALGYFKAKPGALANTLNGYNNANPSTQIVPGRAQKMQYALIGGGVLVAVVVMWVIWKKVLKK